ncbi:hypothetical protein LTR66_007079 [Elasticomyces elasticus]|nr:hypothetical protein LTR66_007079 [Elasticomyces elasticus]KAK4990762.1 hypothetical protein LTR50_002298 [Elasticomyces elasticus]
MFCLRSWIPVLFFLANAPPVYLILFVTATYLLNRPCVYCSLLLAILVIALYDFHQPWFETNDSSPADLLRGSGSTNVKDALLETAAAAVSAVTGTATFLLSATAGAAKQKIRMDTLPSISMFEWVKSLIGKREFRVACLDLSVRL